MLLNTSTPRKDQLDFFGVAQYMLGHVIQTARLLVVVKCDHVWVKKEGEETCSRCGVTVTPEEKERLAEYTRRYYGLPRLNG